MVVFPKGKHDDQVDSTAQFLDWFKKPMPSWGIFEYYRMQAEKLQRRTESWVRLRAPPSVGSVQTFSGRHLNIGPDGHSRDVCGGCRVPYPCRLDQNRRMDPRRRSLTPMKLLGTARALATPRRAAPREIRVRPPGYAERADPRCRVQSDPPLSAVRWDSQPWWWCRQRFGFFRGDRGFESSLLRH
jgi:hypothetical protein